MIITLLTDRFGYRESIEEERNVWLYEVLAYLGIDPSVFYEVDGPDAADVLFDNQVEIIDYPSLEAIEVRYRNDVIGEWGGPVLELKLDSESGKLYYEVKIECWSVLDEEIDISV